MYITHYFFAWLFMKAFEVCLTVDQLMIFLLTLPVSSVHVTVQGPSVSPSVCPSCRSIAMQRWHAQLLCRSVDICRRRQGAAASGPRHMLWSEVLGSTQTCYEVTDEKIPVKFLTNVNQHFNLINVGYYDIAKNVTLQQSPVWLDRCKKCRTVSQTTSAYIIHISMIEMSLKWVHDVPRIWQ